MWQPARLAIPDRRTAAATSRSTPGGCGSQRRVSPVASSRSATSQTVPRSQAPRSGGMTDVVMVDDVENPGQIGLLGARCRQQPHGVPDREQEPRSQRRVRRAIRATWIVHPSGPGGPNLPAPGLVQTRTAAPASVTAVRFLRKAWAASGFGLRNPIQPGVPQGTPSYTITVRAPGGRERRPPPGARRRRAPGPRPRR